MAEVFNEKLILGCFPTSERVSTSDTPLDDWRLCGGLSVVRMSRSVCQSCFCFCLFQPVNRLVYAFQKYN